MALRELTKFSAWDIWDTPEDGKRYEVIDGELYVSPPPVVAHQWGLTRLLLLLGQYVDSHDCGMVFVAPIGVVLGIENGLQPDLVYVSRQRQHIITEKAIEGAPDLVVEVLSPSTRARDKGIKRRVYQQAGIPHYWVLDPKTRTLEALKLGTRGYESLGVFRDDEEFAPELFPGLVIRPARLWD